MSLHYAFPSPALSCATSKRTRSIVPRIASSSFKESRRHASGLLSCNRSASMSPLLQEAAGHIGRQRLGVVCMAHPRRIARVSSQIHREISNLFVTDQVLVSAICPERAGGSSEISAVASVTDVYVSNDLQVVKVYISIYSDARGKKRAMNRLKKLEGYTRTQIGQRVVLRLTPEIRFEYDDSQDQAEMIQRAIGAKDVQRFKRELELEQQEEASPWGQQGGDSGGLFDEYETNEVIRVQGKQEVKPKGERKLVVVRTEDQMMQPGPFDDLFAGSDDDEPWIASRDNTLRNRAKRQRQKQQKQQ